MWIEASVDDLALLADGTRLVGGGFQGSHAWSLESGELITTFWNYGSFRLGPHEHAIVYTRDFDETLLHRLDGSPRANLPGRFVGFSRDGTRVMFEATYNWLTAYVADIDGTYLGSFELGHLRGADHHAHIVRADELHDGWYAVQTTHEVQLRQLGGRMTAELLNARLACTTGDGRFFLTCDARGVTIVETATGNTTRIDVIATNDLARADGAGRLLIPHRDGAQHLLVVDHARGTSRREFVVGDWVIEELIAGNGVIAIARGARQLAFVDVERGRIVETAELEEDSRVAIDHAQATIAIVSPAGRFEVWSIEPPALLERDQLPAGPRRVAIGPRHVAIAYDRLVLVRPRP